MPDRYSSLSAGYGVVPLRDAAGTSGLAFLSSMLADRLPAPPFTRWARTILVEVSEGRAVFEGEPSADFLNPLGTVHGGWTAGILDSAMACAVHTTLKAGEGYTTLEYKIHCVRPVLPTTGLVRCEGVVLSRARRAATSEGRLYDPAGKLLAHGTETCLIFDVPLVGNGQSERT
jgi:uncharacterized protein (TIGR00369 family)